jgi:3-oxoacyl-[acyl-carrier-protein] synthase II
VVITALGTAGAWGGGSAGLIRALAAGAPPATALMDPPGIPRRPGGARRALLTPAAALAPWLQPAEARRMSRQSRLAVTAARMAVADAGLPAAGLAGPGTAVVMATAFGAASVCDALLHQILLEGPESASPSLFTESVANAPAAQVAIAAGACGANLTLCQREAGALLAVARAAAEVAAGRAERALAGAVDEISPLLHALLDRFGALARPSGLRAAGAAPRPEGSGAAGGSDAEGRCGEGRGGEGHGAEIARPFDRRRNGVLAADGATVLLLESEEAAERRGRRPLARVRAWGSAFDPEAPPTGWSAGAGERLGRALLRMLARAGAAPGSPGAVDRIASGAAGSRAGDRLEARVLRVAWGEAPLPPVLAPKGVTGEYGGGFLAATVLAAAGLPGVADGPAAGFGEPDPELGVSPHDGSALPPPRSLLASSLAAGGAASWLLLERG